MTTAAQAIGWLKGLLGQRDNKGAFIWRRTEFASYVGYAYCGATQLALCEALGLDIAPVTSHARLLYVPAIVQDAKAAGRWRPSVQSQPGDWCVFRWDGNMNTDQGNHVTMVLANNPAKDYITVIGGNHGDGITSGERGVFVRTWPRSVVLGTVNRQAAYTAEPTKTATAAPAGGKPVLQIGSTGTAVRNLQTGLLGVFPAYAKPIANSGGADGIYGPGTKQVVTEFQKRSGLTADGVVGPLTWAALGRAGIKP